jgi:arylsulfatase A-like enzyme
MNESPNVLCVSLDSLRRDHAPFVTGEETTPPLTPFLDEFATDATTFTGLYPPEHGVLDRGYTLGDHPTFAELLADAGYETGFATRNDWVTFGDILEGFGDVDLQSRAGDDGPVERLRDAYEETPIPDVHWPYTPRAPNHRRYTDRGPLALFWNRAHWQPRLYDGRHRCWAGLLDPPPEQVELLRALYRGRVYATDRLPTGSDDRLVDLSDVYPTVLELCGVDPPETTSYSLLGDERRETAFCYYTLPNGSHLEDQLATVPAERLPPRRQYCAWRSPEEKLVWYPDRDEYAGPAAGDESLRRALEDHLDRRTRVPTGSRDVSDEALSRLDSMGYL